jgi:BirA family biotin operon repressor/biotin-[acetyl-CoA-carboxylase] ligase
LPDATRFRGTIRGVKPTGDLVVEHENGEVKSYLFKEIEFVI